MKKRLAAGRKKFEFNSSKFEIEREDLYVFPEIQNLTCLGKLGKISATENIYTGVVYTNTKFINLVLNCYI